VRRLSGDQGYLLADNNYDHNILYTRVAGYGHQLVAPPRSMARGLGHHRQSRYRLRSLHLVKTAFGGALLALRKPSMERFFGNLGWPAGGLSQLPGFVRTLGRVRRWVEAKLILHALRREKTLELA